MVVSESLYLHFRSNQTSSFLPKLEATNDELTWFGMQQFLCSHKTSFFLFSKQYQPWSDIWLFIGWILGRKIWTKVGYKSTSPVYPIKTCSKFQEDYPLCQSCRNAIMVSHNILSSHCPSGVSKVKMKSIFIIDLNNKIILG